jgi:hypothetical protein
MTQPIDPKNAERPSAHGRLGGQYLSALADCGRRRLPPGTTLPEMCVDCAFRLGTMPNQMGATIKSAIDCVLGIGDHADEDFACHHGMRDGHPTKICAGYVAALLATPEFKKQGVIWLAGELDKLSESHDPIRIAFDTWLSTIDPERKMDNYQLARAYAARQQ